MSIKIIFIIPFLLLTLSANERIISLSPSITEIVYALDKGDDLIATSDYSLYPPKAKELKNIGSYSNPNIEKIISLSPALVIGQEFNESTLEKLRYFKIKTLKLNLKTISSIKSSISILAKKINSKNADKLLNNINNAITNTPRSKQSHSVMIVYGLHEDLRNGIYIAGHDIFFEDIIRECGNTNAYVSNLTSQPVLNYENVIALNPQQIIILHSHATESQVNIKKALKAWYALPTDASKNKNISIIDEDYLHIPSHRIALTISRLCKEMNK
ncbi:MAG: helical backbone metal receptor [Sulfurimonas sp.]|nr:helical backbone metal receptor [Sulfurimonas sp.]